MSFNLNEQVTIWNSVKTGDGLGGFGYLDPVTVAARSADTQEQFTDEMGNKQISQKVTYTQSTEIQTGSLVHFGVSTSATPTADRLEVRKVKRIPAVTNMVKVWF